MFRVDLANLPFASLSLPSIALMQLEEVTKRRFGDEVSTDIHYLNHAFAEYFGVEEYQELSNSVRHVTSGVGDWFFRHVAFPELEDNADAYFRRYYRSSDDEAFRETILERREGAEREVDRLIDERDLASADVVGLTSMFSTHGAALALTRKIKERDPSTVTVLGGANCEAPMGRVIADEVDWVDFVFSGPALRSFPRFLEHQRAGEEEKCHRIDGVFSARNRTEEPEDDMIETASAAGNGDGSADEGVPTVAALGEELPIEETPHGLDYQPFLEKMDERFPDEQVERQLLFETSRGCWWGEKAHCTFCGLNGATMNYRSLDSEAAREVFDSLFEYAPYASEIQLHCVDNIIPKPYFDEVLPDLDTPDNMNLFYEVKANLSREQVRVMAEARVDHFQPGIEALSTDVLKLMRKGTTAFVNLELLKHCRRYDVMPAWNLLVGFPGEPEEVYETYLDDLPLLTHLPPPTGVFPIRFDRYSPYFTTTDAYDLDLAPLDFYELTYPFDEDRLETLAYYFQDKSGDADYRRHVVEYLPALRERLEDWKAGWSGDGAQPPRLALHRRDGSPWIRDSRPAFDDEYPIDPEEARVLEAMGEMTKIQLLADDLPSFEESRLERVVAGLEQRGLVFTEEDRLMSLVLPADAYAPFTRDDGVRGEPLRANLTA